MGLIEKFPTLDDKTFEDLVQEARMLIARYCPEWTDHNVHDPGITFMELFAWLAEMQMYQLNQVSNENYLRFLKLVGLYPQGAQPARVDITFKNNKIESEKIIEAGTQIITEVGSKEIIFETEEDFTLTPTNLISVITKYDSRIVDNTKANEKDDVYFSAFGEDASATGTLLLGFDKPFSEKEIQITIDIFDNDLSSLEGDENELKDFIPSARLAWEYLVCGKWNALSVKKDTSSDLTRSGRITFAGFPEMHEKDKPCWIRCRIKEGTFEIPPRIKSILLNTISVVQVETVKGENLKLEHVIPDYKTFVQEIPVVKGSQKILEQKGKDEWEEWKEVEDFELSGPDDCHYMFNYETGTVTFGNGLNGKIPLESLKIKASYKTTLGAQGNVPKEQVWQVKKEGFEGIYGQNAKGATGGKPAESLEQAKGRAKKYLRECYRAITSNDYEELARLTPGLRISRVKSIPNYNPEYPCVTIPGAVTIVVVPYTRDGAAAPAPGKGFLQTIRRHIEMHRLITTDLYVIGPEYVKVSVKCSIYLKKKYSPKEVRLRVKKALADFLNPLKGGPDKKGWPFGRPVYPSEIYQLIDEVEGVNYATGVSISAEGKYQKVEDIIKIPPVGLALSGEHHIEAVQT